MANKNSNTPPQVNSAEQAIKRVLEAERETRHAITECEQAAHALLLEARQRARHIHDRTDQRISNMKIKVAQRITATLKDMGRAEAKALREQAVQPLDETDLMDCIEQVACLLSGGTPKDDKDRDPEQ